MSQTVNARIADSATEGGAAAWRPKKICQITATIGASRLRMFHHSHQGTGRESRFCVARNTARGRSAGSERCAPGSDGGYGSELELSKEESMTTGRCCEWLATDGSV